MRVHIFASGSGGNATLFLHQRTRILVDAGLSARGLTKAMNAVCAGHPGLLDAIVITHAHRDHLGYAESISERYQVPVYMTESTYKAAGFAFRTRPKTYSPREPFSIASCLVAPLPLPHDAAQVALMIHDGTSNVAIVTDLGEVPPSLSSFLRETDVLLIESNHDAEMLERGPYPAFLKQRIRSSRGHLSNAQTHALLKTLSPQCHTVVLMHLSETNNLPSLAMESAQDAIGKKGVSLAVAKQADTLVIDTQHTLKTPHSSHIISDIF